MLRCPIHSIPCIAGVCVQCGLPGVETTLPTPATPAPSTTLPTPATSAPSTTLPTPATPAPSTTLPTPATPAPSTTPDAPRETTPAPSSPVIVDGAEVPIPAALSRAIEDAMPLLRSGIMQITRAALLVLRAVVTVARDELHP